ncbi:MAG: glycoside hydrolase family 88 protein [Candidatus Azobacteroides sp.]|nr:glycoside hydrolase family 88 protein [Candidatus Azobacteroides sp.]
MKNLITICVICSLFSCSAQQKIEQEKYSQLVVESLALKTFLSNTKEEQLVTAHWDYVPGLVAVSVLKAWQQYPEKTDYYDAVKQYADYCLQGSDTVKVRESNIDDLAAGKIFFTLYQEEIKRGNISDATRYKHCATYLRNKLKYSHRRIDASKPGTGAFFHKMQYPDQLWLDGLYMGPAMYAEWQYNFGEESGLEDNIASWSDIALQFKIINQYTYNPQKGLNYHVWSADPTDVNSFWAKKSNPYLGCSPEFWGRGMGWFFAALVDVLDLMPKSHPDYQDLKKIVNQVAAGLAKYQDPESGCWYQLLQYDADKRGDNVGDKVIDATGKEKIYNQCDNPNYIESSASSMFTYAYLKGIRIGVLDAGTYKLPGEKAYRGLIKQFIVRETNGNISVIQSCASAGLGPASDLSRTGTVNYYLCGKDIAITKNEGKAIGPFIMASLEYERR